MPAKKTPTTSSRAKASAKKTTAKKAPAKKAPAKKTASAKKAPAKKAPAKKAAATRRSTAAKTTKSKATTTKKAPAKRTAAAKSTSSRKTAAAKKSPAKKASTSKTSTSRKTPAKKAPAKKATTSKAAAAKKAPAKRATAKKAPAKRATASKAAANKPKPAAKAAKVPFKVGDKVVYPHHGAATIIKKERIEFGGEKTDYFVLEVATDQLTVRVPTLKAVELGVRPVISKTVARKVFATFKEDPQEAGSNWSRWYKLLTEKINSGDIFQVAEVVRDLTYAQQIKGISPALKRMLAKARLIIISELRFALVLDEEEAIKKLDRALPKVEQPVEA